MNTVCTIQSVLFNIRKYSHIVVINLRQRREDYSREEQACGAPDLCGSPALFICYLLYAINTLGYSPFCFRIASQILLLVSCLRSVRSARATSGVTSRTPNTRSERLWAINFWDSLFESYKWPRFRIWPRPGSAYYGQK